MKIIVIDDNHANQKSAELLREDGHEVEVIGTVAGAYERLRRGGFDLLLTDLMMPLADFTGALAPQVMEGGLDRQKEHPVGLIFAAKAVNMGIRAVICTDSDHHRNEMCALLDLLGSSEPNRGVMFVEARAARLSYGPYKYISLSDDGKWVKAEKDDKLVKDWRKVMERLMMRDPKKYPSLDLSLIEKD